MTRGSLLGLLCVSAALAQTSSQTPPPSGPETGPDFSSIRDVTNGQTYLLENDDLTYLEISTSNGQVNTNLSSIGTSQSYAVPYTGGPIYSNPTQPTNGTVTSGNYGAVGAGRMFNTVSDQVAKVSLVGITPSWVVQFFDPKTNWQSLNFAQNTVAGTANAQIVMGDFRGDKLQEALVYTSSSGTNSYSNQPIWSLQVYYPTDPSTEGAISIGPAYTQFTTPLTQGSVVVGDFNGDGRDEIAVLMGDGQTVTFYTVDPKTFAITQGTTVTLPYTLRTDIASLAAGNFTNTSNTSTGTPSDSLIAVGTVVNGEGIGIYPIQITIGSNGAFTAKVVPSDPLSQSSQYFTLPNRRYAFGVQAAAATFGSSPTAGNAFTNQQLAIFTKTGDDGYVDILSFNPQSWQYSWQSFTDLEINTSGIVSENMQVGNFDSGSLAPQLAFYTVFQPIPVLNNGVSQVEIYNVTPQNPLPSPEPVPPPTWLTQPAATTVITNFANSGANPISGMIMAADVEGRSLRLGAPQVVRVNKQKQPTVALGMPPMHVDWIAPHASLNPTSYPDCQNPSVPCIFNLTVQPSIGQTGFQAFYTQFQFDSGTSSSTKSTSTTSWGISAGVSTSESASFSDGEESASESLTASVKYAHDNNVSQTYNTFQGSSQALTWQTGFSDFLFFTEETMNVYYYPVLGSLVCPNNEVTCAASDKRQQYVEFSGPDNIYHYAVAANQEDWYQPVHEAGNILTYPSSFTTLANEYTNTPVPLATPPGSCATPSGSSGSTAANWSATSSSGQTAGTTNSLSTDASLSYSEGVGDESIGEGAQVSTTLDFGTSTSLSTLNENTTAESSSTGIFVNMPAFSSDVANCCSYGYNSYIYGMKNTSHPSAQVLTPVDPDSKNNVQVNGTGPLFVGFTVGVLGANPDNGCSGPNGNWWAGTTYVTPDVGVSHPSRWGYDQGKQQAYFYKAAPVSQIPAIDQEFYQMRGFFITLHGEAATSPTLSTVAAGADLDLTARIYNYSLASVPPLDRVHVRFYAQAHCLSGASTEPSCVVPGSTTTCASLSLCGSPFQVGEQVLPAPSGMSSIPGFEQQPGQSNWTTATTEMNTANYPLTANGGASLVFWVVTWMEDGNGKVVSEMPGHGMAASFNPAASYSQVTDIPLETYSNNLGLFPYNSQFYIEPNATLGATSPQTGGSLKNIRLAVPAQSPFAKTTKVVATLSAASPLKGVTVNYYDGDPNNGGALIDTQTVLRMSPGASYLHRTLFKPSTCGLHTLYVSAFQQNTPSVQASGKTMVTADANEYIQALIASTQAAGVSDPAVLQSLLATLSAASQSVSNNGYAVGIQQLQQFEQAVMAASGSSIPAQHAEQLVTQAQIIIGCGPSGFFVVASPGTRVVAGGVTGEYALQISSGGGYSGSLTVTCSGAPAGSQCSPTPASLQLSSNSTTSTTIKVTTGGQMVAGFLPLSPATCLRWLWLCPLFVYGVVRLHRARTQGRILLGLSLSLLLFIIGTATGCGGDSGQTTPQTTPPGTYNLTVSVSDGATTQQSMLKLVVE